MRIVLITRIHENLSLRGIGIYMSTLSTRDNVIFALAESHAVPRAERKCSYRCHNTLDENLLRKKIGGKRKKSQYSVLCRMHARACVRIPVEITITFRLPELNRRKFGVIINEIIFFIIITGRISRIARNNRKRKREGEKGRIS